MIVVTTPTGNIGAHVVKHLLAAGEPLRLIVRDPKKLPDAVRDQVEIVEGSHGDADVLDRRFAVPTPCFGCAHPRPRQRLPPLRLISHVRALPRCDGMASPISSR